MVSVLLMMHPPSGASCTPILTYHDMQPERTASSLWFDCSVPEFESQIQFFKARKAVFISVSQLTQNLKSRKPNPAKAVCLTFADNYLGFYKYAWPIIKRERIPCTMFVHTGFVGSKVGRPKMNWDQLRELDRSGLVTVASQTVNHPEDLTVLSDEKVKQEFLNSKLRLERELGHPQKYLAYPNGKYDDRISGLAKNCGYEFAFTEVCVPSEKAPDLWRIPRYVHTRYKSAWVSKLKSR